jgi:hypothetical protein
MPSAPKNQKFTNRHAAEAQNREAEKKVQDAAARAKAKEDAEWEDDDKATLKKLERQREREEKAAAQAERKAENRELYQVETKKAKKGGAMEEFRRAQAEIAREHALAQEAKKTHPVVVVDKNTSNVEADKSLIEKNTTKGKKNNDDDDNEPEEINISTSSKVKNSADAQTLEDILKGVDPTSDEFRRKMGRRAKVLYKQFCEEHEKQAKEENPGLRRTQLNDVLWEMWQQCPQNPFVQRKSAIHADRIQKHRQWMEGEGDESEEEETK